MGKCGLFKIQLWVANVAALYRGPKSPKSGKEGFGVKKLPFPSDPEKGRFESKKSPFSLSCPAKKWGFFGLKAPFSGSLGNGSFLTPKPPFPDFGGFDPCTGPPRSQVVDRSCSGNHFIRVTRFARSDSQIRADCPDSRCESPGHCCRRSFFLSIPFSYLFFLENKHF